ncbi:hypothetical protein DMN91_012289 [Ooceraea biroi]|uniref:Uncharacterized protein n=1 Tax=Ooceraea biroi TaxID=2015173 RepID=A0A3L8D4A9_OOCBI|nr:hypothetical protein DMN91_012289 [Ooceraea biroi]
MEKQVCTNTRHDRHHACASSSGLSFLVRESGSPESAGGGDLASRMSAKISVAGCDAAAQSTVNHRAARSSPAKRPLSPEATAITERSPKRTAVLPPKSSSNGISGRSSPEEASEMPVLTRVCSPATLPRLKRFRFRPIDAGAEQDSRRHFRRPGRASHASRDLPTWRRSVGDPRLPTVHPVQREPCARAINVNCSDRFNRRRLQLGKATLADLVTAREGKELLRRRQFKEVIVYDDCTDDLEHLPASIRCSSCSQRSSTTIGNQLC